MVDLVTKIWLNNHAEASSPLKSVEYPELNCSAISNKKRPIRVFSF